MSKPSPEFVKRLRIAIEGACLPDVNPQWVDVDWEFISMYCATHLLLAQQIEEVKHLLATKQ